MAATYPITEAEDIEMLMKIRRYLIGFRITNGWTQEELSLKLNGTKGGVYMLENDNAFHWRFSRLQGWPVPFGLKLHAHIELPGDPDRADLLANFINRDKFVQVYGQLVDTDPQWQRAYLIASLKSLRQGLGWDLGALAKKLKVTPGAVSRWECEGDQVLLPKMIAHARALGGRLVVEVGE